MLAFTTQQGMSHGQSQIPPPDTLVERCKIDALLSSGHTRRAIAQLLGIAPSTVAREVHRNCDGGMEHHVRKFAKKNIRWQDARISTDKPDKVNRWFDFPKNRFECELKRTGTKGTYWLGKIWLAERDKPSNYG